MSKWSTTRLSYSALIPQPLPAFVTMAAWPSLPSALRHGLPTPIEHEPDRIVERVAEHMEKLISISRNPHGIGRRLEHEADRTLLHDLTKHRNVLLGEVAEVESLAGPRLRVVARLS